MHNIAILVIGNFYILFKRFEWYFYLCYSPNGIFRILAVI